MANLAKWGTPATYDAALSTGLNSLADGSSASSSAIANGTDFYPLMDVSIILASMTPGTGGYIEIHVAPLLDDGSSYPDIFLGGPTWVGSLTLKTGASAKDAMLTGIQIPPGDFKVALLNKAGASLAASSNTVKTRRYSINLNA
jgi:hypothetical protein